MFQTSFRRVLRPLSAFVALTLVAAAAVPRAVPASAAHSPYSSTMTTAPFDEQFIDMMVPHHQSAVGMAQVALTRAGHRQIKSLARAIVAAQDGEMRQMKIWRMQWYGSATTPDMGHMPLLPGLKTTMNGMSMMHDIVVLKTAKTFDKAFIDAMTPHHQLAIEAATLELAHGSHAPLKALALSIIKGQSREEGLMQAYRDLWYGSATTTMSGM